MPKIRFHRTNNQRRIHRTIPTQSISKCMSLNRIAHRCTRSMGFHKPNLQWRNPRVQTRLLHQTRLRLRTRQRNPIRMPVLIQGRPNNHPMNRIPISNRLRKPLQQNHPRSLPTHKPVRRRIKRFALPLRRKHPRLRKPNKSPRRNHHRHPARQRHIATPRPNVITSRMHRRQGRRTRRIHRHTRPQQVQTIGNPIGRNAVRTARRRMRRNPHRIPRRPLNHLVVIMRNSHKNPQIGPLLKVQNQPSILNRLPSRLQKQPVLRIHISRFPRRNPKKLGVKLVDSLHKSPTLRHRLPSQTRLGIIVTFRVPPIGRHITNRLFSCN